MMRHGQSKQIGAQFCAFSLALIALIFSAGTSDAVKSHGKYKGIELYTSPTKPNTKYDEDITPNSKALKKIRHAIDLIYTKSKYSAGKIDFLKKRGRVIIVYDPHVPDPDVPTASLLMAQFYPTYLRDGDTKGSGSTKDFLVIVTRIGILQDLTDVASVVVHELVGHGIQHHRGRLETMRIIDIECEAWLYQERSYQDFGIDKFSKEMGQFRTQLEDRECSDFRRHQATKYPKMYKLWDETNPNVPKLLANFDQYLKDIRGSVTKSALNFSEKEQKKDLDKVFSSADAKAILDIGMGYHSGIYAKPDLKEAARWFLRAAELNSSEAQYRVAWAYFKGDGVRKSEKKALKWYLNSANQGHPRAKNNVGVFFRDGLGGLKRDYKKAAGYFKEAKELGYAEAIGNLAWHYRYGRGLKKNYVEAASLYANAINRDVISAFYELGEMYRRGLGVKKSFRKARDLYEQGSKKGNSSAKIGLAKVYIRGQGGPKKVDAGLKILHGLAKGPNAKSQLALAKLYWNGKYVPKDLKLAAKWYQKAAARGSRTGQAALGFMYLKGKGVALNYTEAASWLKKAAEKGHRNAQYLLGTLYDDGKGVSKDPALALSWFKKAASRGHKKAKSRLKN